MELSITIPSEDSYWILEKLDAANAPIAIATTIDGVSIRFGTCRLRMDQSAMTATNGYDETLTFDVKHFYCQAAAPPAGLTSMAPDDGNRGALEDEPVEPYGDGEPTDPEQRRGGLHGHL